MSVPFEGGCLCGAVRYTCNAEPVFAGHCHCVDCRRSSGTGHSGLDPFPWTPDQLGERSPRCRLRVRLIHPSSGSRWSS